MSQNIFVTSDHHFGHARILTFAHPDGTLLRPGFANVDEMNEFMIDAWNEVVKPTDKVYHLGDVAIKESALKFLDRCHGTKRLVRGNHDIYDTKKYLRHFKEIYASRVLGDVIMTHIPIHPESVKRFQTNVHGHLHNNIVEVPYGPHYLNVCVELTNYRPVAWEDLMVMIRQQREAAGLESCKRLSALRISFPVATHR